MLGYEVYSDEVSKTKCPATKFPSVEVFGTKCSATKGLSDEVFAIHFKLLAKVSFFYTIKLKW